MVNEDTAFGAVVAKKNLYFSYVFVIIAKLYSSDGKA